MRIIVESGPKEGSKTVAVFLHNLLSSWGVPVTLDVAGDLPRWGDGLKRKIRKIADSLEHPIEIGSRVVQDSSSTSRWQDYLVEDPDDGVIVKGTFVTVGYVVSLIVDGWSWREILTRHPELCEDDIRACLNYAVEQGEYQFHECCQEDSCQRRQDASKAMGHARGNMANRRPRR